METKAESRAQSESSGNPRYPHAVQLCVVVVVVFFFPGRSQALEIREVPE